MLGEESPVTNVAVNHPRERLVASIVLNLTF
jgi:hypothetical protein